MLSESETLAQQAMLLSEMQAETKRMLAELRQQQKDLELQQEELRQYHSQVLRALSTFRLLLEQARKGRED